VDGGEIETPPDSTNRSRRRSKRTEPSSSNTSKLGLPSFLTSSGNRLRPRTDLRTRRARRRAWVGVGGEPAAGEMAEAPGLSQPDLGVEEAGEKEEGETRAGPYLCGGEYIPIRIRTRQREYSVIHFITRILFRCERASNFIMNTV
jgi:hypothetical protein